MTEDIICFVSISDLRMLARDTMTAITATKAKMRYCSKGHPKISKHQGTWGFWFFLGGRRKMSAFRRRPQRPQKSAKVVAAAGYVKASDSLAVEGRKNRRSAGRRGSEASLAALNAFCAFWLLLRSRSGDAVVVCCCCSPLLVEAILCSCDQM